MSASLMNILVFGFGILYLVGAGFHTAYTWRHADEFYESFANRTWFTPARWFIHKFVIPTPGIFTITLILYHIFVAVALLSQGPYVELGLLAGVAFCMYAVFVSNITGATVNLALAVLQFYLASAK